jgi:bifunctional aspartokinase / homoserine dehydrogenase 1
MRMRTVAPEIWKFGGASVADAAAIRRVARLVAAHRGPLVVVVSALSGVTDSLLDGARRAAAGDTTAAARSAAAFLERHRQVASALVATGSRRRGLLRLLADSAREYEELARALSSLRALPARVSDLLVARGERLACALLAAALRQARVATAAVDATRVVATDEHHGNAAPDQNATALAARAFLRPLLRRGKTVVVPGFLGAAPDGSVTTMGRGGSDLTATLLARALGARRAVLWKDVPGMLTADPRLVEGARVIPQLHYREAAEAAYYGAKVLHPRALIPLDGSRARLVVRSFLEPQLPGTEISSRRTLAAYPVKAIAAIAGQAVVTVAGRGMLGVPGIAARTFAAVHHEGVSVSTIFQASSESSIGFTLPEADSERAVRALRHAFREELQAGLIDGVSARPGVAVVAVVGNGMAGTPGISARVFAALAAARVNVIAIAQGSSERNISFVVQAAQAGEAARRVHAAFQLSKIGGGRAALETRTDVVLLGFGRVGRALADQLAQRAGGVRVVAALDRSGYVFDPRGISRGRLLRLARAKDDGAMLESLGARASAREALHLIAGHAVSRPILVDVTAEETGEVLRAALAQGFDLVLANKKPLAGAHESYAGLLLAAARAERRIRYEATVGAGLPILDTHRKLVESGDVVTRIEGCVSGTLGFVLSAVCAGGAFSAAVREAVARGYAEPDPREDLSGRDAARKGLILARLVGYAGAVPQADDLVPEGLRRLPLGRFLERLPMLDAAWAARAARARARGRVLRYVVRATRASVEARLVAVPAGSPAGALQGARNLVAFTTRRYRSEPLVITGPGAGAEVTAAGILNDIQSLAATARS